MHHLHERKYGWGKQRINDNNKENQIKNYIKIFRILVECKNNMNEGKKKSHNARARAPPWKHLSKISQTTKIC